LQPSYIISKGKNSLFVDAALAIKKKLARCCRSTCGRGLIPHSTGNMIPAVSADGIYNVAMKPLFRKDVLHRIS
jgi:hypothetical protein